MQINAPKQADKLAHNLVLVRSDAGDGGWSLHAPGSTDDEIAQGDAPALLIGEAEMIDGQWNAPTKTHRIIAALRVAE